jgi:UDP-N-acetyl-D-galactosamine dehydrogenase
VVDVINELNEFHCNIDVYDPWIDKEESQEEYGITPIDAPQKGKYDAVIVAVSHKQFKEMGVDGIRELGKESHVLYDIKYILPAEQVDGRL